VNWHYLIGISTKLHEHDGYFVCEGAAFVQFRGYGSLMCLKYVVLMSQCDQIGLVYFGNVLDFSCRMCVCESVPEPTILAQAS